MDEPTNCVLQLYINSDLKKLAKKSGLNLSKEFEEWIKIRLGQIEVDKPVVNIDLEIAKHQSEIQKLQSQVILKSELELKGKEESLVVDSVIDDMINGPKGEKYKGKTLKDLFKDKEYGIDSKIHGIQFLFQKKFKKVLNPLEARELIEKRIKERGLIK
jgi:hypothetical protein